MARDVARTPSATVIEHANTKEIPDFRDNVDALIKELEAELEAADRAYMADFFNSFHDEKLNEKLDEMERELECWKRVRKHMLPPKRN